MFTKRQPCKELSIRCVGIETVGDCMANEQLYNFLPAYVYSVSKFRVRVLPSILENIRKKNELPKRLIFSFTRLIEFYKYGTPIDDPAIINDMCSANIPAILLNNKFWAEGLSYLADTVQQATREGVKW